VIICCPVSTVEPLLCVCCVLCIGGGEVCFIHFSISALTLLVGGNREGTWSKQIVTNIYKIYSVPEKAVEMEMIVVMGQTLSLSTRYTELTH